MPIIYTTYLKYVVCVYNIYMYTSVTDILLNITYSLNKKKLTICNWLTDPWGHYSKLNYTGKFFYRENKGLLTFSQN